MKKNRSKENLILTNKTNIARRNWRLVGITLFSMSLGLIVSDEVKADTVKNASEATVKDSSPTIESEKSNTINVVTADSSKASSSTASTADSSDKSDIVPVTGNSATASSADTYKAASASETTPAQKAEIGHPAETAPLSEANNAKQSSSSDSQVQSEKQASSLVRPAAKSTVKTSDQSVIKTTVPQPAAARTPEKGGAADYTYDDSKATAPETPWQKDGYKGLQYLNDPNDPTRALNYDDPAYPPIPSAKGWSVYVYYYHANKKHGQGWMLLPQLDPNDASKGTKYPPDFEGDQDGGERINMQTGKWHYPGDSGYSAQDLMAAGVNTYVSIFPNLQIAKVNFIDDSTGKTLGVTQLNGRTEYTSTYHPENKIAQLKKIGYTLVSSDFPDTLIYDNDNGGTDNKVDQQIQRFVIHLAHTLVPVSPGNPGIPGQPIDPNNPDGPKWPNDASKENLVSMVTRTITYVDKKTVEEIAPKVVQTVTYSRTATVDEVTGKVSYSDWQLTTPSSELAEVNSPDLSKSGYDAPDKAAIPAVQINEDYHGNRSLKDIVSYKRQASPVTPKTPATLHKVVPPKETKKTNEPAKPNTPVTIVLPNEPAKPQTVTQQMKVEKTDYAVNAFADNKQKSTKLAANELPESFPKTGEEKGTGFEALGVGMLGVFGSLLALFGIRRKDEK